MKITVESMPNGKVELSLEVKGKKYTEVHYKDKEDNCYVEGMLIIEQLKMEGICVEQTGIDFVLDSVNVSNIIDLSQREEEYL